MFSGAGGFDFERYAEEAITKMKAALIAVDYYERIRVRLVKKEDLSGELAIIRD